MHKLFFGNATKYYDEKEFKSGYKEVNEYRKNKINKLKDPKDKARSLTAGILFLEACRAFGIEELVNFVKDGEHGKPYFDCPDDMFPNGQRIYFSISHSKDYVLIGMSDEQIGVDIQYMQEIKADIASKCFTKEEQNLYYKASEDEYITIFYQIWCLKESFSKYKGTGLSEGFNTFSVLDYMHDSGLWHDEYIYAVTTHDYKSEYLAKKEEQIELLKNAKNISSVVKKVIREKTVDKIVEENKQEVKPEAANENLTDAKTETEAKKEENIKEEHVKVEHIKVEHIKEEHVKENTAFETNKVNTVISGDEITNVPDLKIHIIDRYNKYANNAKVLAKIENTKNKRKFRYSVRDIV